jgi:hypothetical protein
MFLWGNMPIISSPPNIRKAVVAAEFIADRAER